MEKSLYSDKVIVATDVETTGVSADGCELLEVAVYLLDFNLNVLDPEGFRRVIKYSPDEIASMKNKVTPYVLEMHTKTGLWDALPDGESLESVDDELLAYIKSVAPEARTSFIMGNSVSLDRDFVQKYLPQVGEHLHYRIIDVTSVALLVEAWYGILYEKKGTHSAVEDIQETIAELQYLKRNAFKA